MGLLSHFDLSSDLTQFFVGGSVLVLTFSVLLTWVAPTSRDRRKLRGKVDDRFASTDGELID